MASLKDLKTRIRSVKNTQKITKAMKMVAAAKLRRARDQAEAARPYAEHMQQVLQSVASNISEGSDLPKLLSGTGKHHRHLLVVVSSDRGLCGGLNSIVVRAVKQEIAALEREGKEVILLCVGRKAYDQLRVFCPGKIAHRMVNVYQKQPAFSDAQAITNEILRLIEERDVDVCRVIYNTFKSAISQIVTWQQLMPLDVQKSEGSISAAYEYEPEEEAILADLLPRNVAVQIYKALLENVASEQGARMTAMDNATRNAGDMIKRLTLQYNRSRQAAITKELIEIISGAEAL